MQQRLGEFGQDVLLCRQARWAAVPAGGPACSASRRMLVRSRVPVSSCPADNAFVASKQLLREYSSSEAEQAVTQHPGSSNKC